MREVLELRRQNVELGLFSMFGGADHSEAGPVIRMHFKDWVLLIVEIGYWLFQRPVPLLGVIPKLVPIGYGSWTNYGENALGIAFAIRFARTLRDGDYDQIHATWATAPGMVTWLTHQLTGLGYTLEAHAYDVFRDGGDAFLEAKLRGAQAIRSSTEATCAELRARLEGGSGGDSGLRPLIHCIRRGLDSIPNYQQPKPWTKGRRLEVLSVGRLIEKKGYLKQLEIYERWSQQGVDFQVSIVGGGPLRRRLEADIRSKGLEEKVLLMGELDHSQVIQLYATSSFFLFTGQISASGDRDGFPNVIGEAMAHSLPVFTTDVSGTTEGIVDGVRGTVIDVADPRQAADTILSTIRQPDKLEGMTRAAHSWVLSDFQVSTNVKALRQSLWGDAR